MVGQQNLEQEKSAQKKPALGDDLFKRKLPIGAEVKPDGVHFRVWAPASKNAAVQLISGGTTKAIALGPEANGYFSGLVSEARAGMLYKFQLDSGAFPDPASRYQPEGPHGPSQIIDPNTFRWTDKDWRGVTREGQVIYEMHIGTLTTKGSWTSAMEQLPELARLGVTLLEVMPVADFPGLFGW
jgi:maltooligosyltrehalose trehalohydrolase